MFALESLFVDLIVGFVDPEAVTQFFRDPRTTARIVGVFVAAAGALLGTFLVLRGMSLVSDAISHTVLLGIVVAYLVLQRLSGSAPAMSNPWLLIGATAAGVVTVLLTDAVENSGLVREDAALGLVFPFLFSLAVILLAGYAGGAHLDEDVVMVGEIGVAWADTNAHCLAGCTEVEITPDDERAEISARCTNCVASGISPRDPGAEFVEICTNCGVYAPARAYAAGFIDERPQLVFWPRSVTVTLFAALTCLLFVLLFYKELKLSTFDRELAASFGFRPALIHAMLMVAVSVVAVAAFDAVGSILVIAFFIIPPATAYLLTHRLGMMLAVSVALGSFSAWWGYDLARGELFGLVSLPGEWDTSISAAMVVLMLATFLTVLLVAPRTGLIAAAMQVRSDRARFEELVLLGHIIHHTDGGSARRTREIGWDSRRLQAVLGRLERRGYIEQSEPAIHVSESGRDALAAIRRPGQVS